MAKKTQIIEELCRNICDEIRHWKDVNKNGCNDPFWTDGINMNLTRKHILYFKEQLKDICQKESCDLPAEYYYSTPPKVDSNYMANPKQLERVKRISSMQPISILRPYHYDENQLRLF